VWIFNSLRRSAGVLLVFIACGAYFAFARGGLVDEPRFVDEGAILAQTYYYRLAVTGDWRNPDWLHPAAYDHQPLYKYLIGAALHVTGHWKDIPDSLSVWERWMAGTYEPPAGAPLWIARWTMLLGAAFSCAAVYALGSQARGPITGLLAVGLFALSPVVFTHARRAMIDVTCQGLVAAALAAWIAAYRPERSRKGTVWFLVLAGTSAGLAATAKLNGAVAAIAIIAGAFAALILGPAKVRGLALGGIVTVGFLAVGVFAAIDPYYYCPNRSFTIGLDGFGELNSRRVSPDLVKAVAEVAAMQLWERAAHLLKYRREAMQHSEQTFPKDYLPPRARMVYVVHEGMGRWTAGSRLYSVAEAQLPRSERVQWSDMIRGALFLAASLVGLIYAFREGNAGRRNKREIRFPAVWALAIWPLVECLMLQQNLKVDWDRYYLGVVTWTSVLTAFAVTGSAQRFVDQLRLVPRPADSP
jgi:hypothetical protein